MAISDVYYKGKNLLVCELGALSPDQRKAAFAETAALDKREMAGQFAQTARNFRMQAEPYLNIAAQHDQEAYSAVVGELAIMRTGTYDSVAEGLSRTAVGHYVEKNHNLQLAAPFTASASVFESQEAKLRRSARKDDFMVVVYKVADVIKSTLHMN